MNPARTGTLFDIPPVVPFPTARPGLGFDEASAAVIDYLKSVLPLGFWAVTRYDGVRQLYLEVRDDAYGLGPGGSHLWTDSMCIDTVAGRTPSIAPRLPAASLAPSPTQWPPCTNRSCDVRRTRSPPDARDIEPGDGPTSRRGRRRM